MGLATHPIARLWNVCVCACVYVYECGVCLHLSERIQFGKKSTSPPLKKEHTFCSNKNFFIRLEIRNVNLCVCVFFTPRAHIGHVEARKMSCSVCVWLTPWSPSLIAGSTGCRHMPIFIGS